MAIDEVKQDESGQKNEPLLSISLPAPANGDPRSPLTVGAHNAAAQSNFKKVADLLMALINNQRMMGSIIEQQGKDIKKLTEDNTNLAKTIRELLKENDDEPKPTKRK